MAVLALAGAEGLRDESVEANKKAAAEESQHIEEVGADADGAEGAGAVGEVAKYDGSTMPMLIQPISARTNGKASRTVGRSSRRSAWKLIMNAQ